eukprot:scaffold358147_cov15-Prasinocladus_malaysianus.AAC.1
MNETQVRDGHDGDMLRATLPEPVAWPAYVDVHPDTQRRVNYWHLTVLTWSLPSELYIYGKPGPSSGTERLMRPNSFLHVKIVHYSPRNTYKSMKNAAYHSTKSDELLVCTNEGKISGRPYARERHCSLALQNKRK